MQRYWSKQQTYLNCAIRLYAQSIFTFIYSFLKLSSEIGGRLSVTQLRRFDSFSRLNKRLKIRGEYPIQKESCTIFHTITFCIVFKFLIQVKGEAIIHYAHVF